MPSTRGCLLSFKQSRLFLSSTKAHLAVISAHLYPVIYSFLPMIYVVLCCDEALEGTKEHLCAPWRASSLGTFLWDLLWSLQQSPSPALPGEPSTRQRRCKWRLEGICVRH